MNIAEEKARKNLAAVYRLVHHFGWDDTIFTHISAKISGTEEFLINEFGLLFNEVTADNLVKVDINGTVISGGIINPAGFVIHSAIHEARPEVSCIVHTHTRDGVAVSADRRGLMPISQQAGIVKQSLAYHDYFGIATNTNEREWLQKNLQDKKFMILRNHGLLTVGTSIPEAFMNMYILQQACEIQTRVNIEHSLLITPEVLSTFNQRKADMFPGGPKLFWKALLRMIKYP
jgi:ribulose-5-phosphate 4-epimerase/fuculose-1-phosphate aldolase